MKAHSKQFHFSAPSRRFVWVALLVICALLSHSLDNCAAHVGGLVRSATDTAQLTAPCPNASGTCEICAPVDQPHTDLCDLLSETAVLTSSQHPIEQQAVTLAATVAVLPAMPQLIALSGCLSGRAEPPPGSLSSVVLRSSLPSRAPPLSA